MIRHAAISWWRVRGYLRVRFVESGSLLDLYPTLIELLDLPKPPQALDGNSLAPLLKDPDAEWDRPVRMTSQMDGVFSNESILSNDFRMTRLATGKLRLL